MGAGRLGGKIIYRLACVALIEFHAFDRGVNHCLEHPGTVNRIETG
jgi:hypothetical protein